MRSPYRLGPVTLPVEPDPGVARFAAAMRASRRRAGLRAFAVLGALAALAAAPLLARTPPPDAGTSGGRGHAGFFDGPPAVRLYPITAEVFWPWRACDPDAACDF